MSTDQRLTWKQICKRYPGQWVVLVDHDWQRHNATEYKSARVIAVGNTRAEAKEHARPLLDAFYEWGCHFTGPLREEVLTLSREDRHALADEIYESLANEPLDPTWEREWAGEIEQRVADVVAGRVELVDADVVHTELRAELRDPGR